jgi:hypothetical protein
MDLLPLSSNLLPAQEPRKLRHDAKDPFRRKHPFCARNILIARCFGSLHLGNTGLTVSYTANAPLGGRTVVLSGSISADGSFRVTGSLDHSRDAQITTVYCHSDSTFAGNFSTGVSFGAHFRAGLQLSNL